MSTEESIERYYTRLSNNFFIIYTGVDPCRDYINTFLIKTSAGRGVIIEPGPHNSADIVYEVLKILGMDRSLELIIPTHVHLDHAGGSAKLAKLTGAAVMAHPRGIPHIRDPSKLWEVSREVQGDIVDLYGKPEEGYNIEILEAKDGLDVAVDDVTLKIIHTPGHASHHISILWREESILFTGDSAGIYLPELDIVLPTTPPPFRYESYMESLKKMISLEPSKLAFTHKGVRKNYDLLKKHYEQMERWFEVLININEKDPEKILNILSGFDQFVKVYLENIDKDCIVNRYNINMTISGFLSEIQRLRSQ
ncbi:MAG: MBL fold metallo-hydrolase [Sulfolobales archaeon]